MVAVATTAGMGTCHGARPEGRPSKSGASVPATAGSQLVERETPSRKAPSKPSTSAAMALRMASRCASVCISSVARERAVAVANLHVARERET